MIAGPFRRLQRVWHEGKTDARAHVDGYRAWRAHLDSLGIDSVAGLRMLDVGCGNRAQLSLLFAADGAEVVGLDVHKVALGWRRPGMWFAVARMEGAREGARLVARDLFHALRYWRWLARFSGRRLPFGKVTFVTGDAAALPFPPESFDIVLSSAVWEHLPDVDAATQEVSRVLKTDGTAIIQIALFPALQGGHHPEWHSVDPDAASQLRPWDHLREDRKALPTYLNEWREGQYRIVFERWLDVIEWEDGPFRGESLLDAEARSALAGFADRDLLLSSVTAWAHRRPVTP